MRVRLTQLDGVLPNIALMKLAHWHRARGDEAVVTRVIEPGLFEGRYDVVYGSALFSFSADRVARFRTAFPEGVLGGTGVPAEAGHIAPTVESHLGIAEYEHYSYDGFMEKRKGLGLAPVTYSLGFTQRGCRLKCKFCVVPLKEGKNRSVNSIGGIWRGEPHARKLHILDNDFFGQPEDAWRARVAEIQEGRFRVCLSQGINVRLITPKAAAALASIEYRDTDFQKRRLYTAWDNLGDEGVFFKGVGLLGEAGIPSNHLMAYMLVGFDKRETWEAIWHRFNRMVSMGIRPYAMVYDRTRKDLTRWQRWVNMGQYRFVKWEDYVGSASRAAVDRRLGLEHGAQEGLFG